MKYIKCISIVTAALMAVVTLQAQTYNDSVRTHTWSVYVQGGASNYYGVRSPLFDNSKKTISPDLSLGIKYNWKPWVRVGLNAGYTMLKATNKGVISNTSTTEGYLVDGKYPATLETTVDIIQNRNNTHVFGLDANIDFNIADIWHKRKAQWFNLYAGVGVGYMRGWNRNSTTSSYNMEAIAQGDSYFNVYSHSGMTSAVNKAHFDALYIPASLSLEFDVQRQLTLGLIGQFKYLPMNKDYSPKGIYSAGIVIRYNFVKSKSKLQQKQILDLYYQLKSSNDDCNDKVLAAQREAADKVKQLENENDNLKQELASARTNNDKLSDIQNTIVYFDNCAWNLSEDNQGRLDKIVRVLKKNPETKVTLIGSANATGKSKYNQKFSDNRVETVKQYLQQQGISDSQFAPDVSLGEKGMTRSVDCRRVIVVVQ